MTTHPYLAVRRPVRMLGGFLATLAVAVTCRGIDLPVGRLPEGSRLTELVPSAMGRLLIVLPIVVIAVSWREPTGEVALAAGRSLVPAHLAHLSAMGGLAIVCGITVGSTESTRIRCALIACAFLGLALLSCAFWGRRTVWALPALGVVVQLLPVPLPGWVGSWAWDGLSTRQLMAVAGVLLVAGVASAMLTYCRPMLAEQSALSRFSAAAD